jgi:DNA (cytosine-5)-methyltransferase 1
MKAFDLFAGIGGFRYAYEDVFKKKNYTTVGWSEIDRYCQKTYSANYNIKDSFFVDDIKKITSPDNDYCTGLNYNLKKKKLSIKKKFVKFDILFAGFPCQSFSSMGNQKGINDTRGLLFYDILAILNSIKPKYFILENVKRLLTIDSKKTFEMMVKSLNSIGYDVSWWVLDSKDYGVPQTRRRLYIYGCLKKLKKILPLDTPPPIRLSTSTLDILQKNVDKKYHLSKKILKTILKDGTGGYYSKSEIDLKIARPLTRTMVKMHRANQDNYYSNKFLKGEKKLKWVRKLTPQEALRLQGFSDKFYHNAKADMISDAQLYMQAGNAVTVNVIKSILKHLANNDWFTE